jgi:hypothetical protein
MSHYPVSFELDRPATMNRAHVFLRIVILVLASWVIGSGGWLGLVYVGFPAAAAVLIARKNGARYLAEDGDRVAGWIAFTVAILAYVALLTDELPGSDRGNVRVNVTRSGIPTVGSALLRIVKGIPSALALALLGLVSSVVWVIATISVLVSERYPESLWNFQSGIVRWEARLLAYLASIVEPYPPFSLDSGANETSTTTTPSAGLEPSTL